ncbi:DUF2784 domain-containing protein [Frigoriglobus tundricola]|uniref:Putative TRANSMEMBRANE PROTEIN n=1 Tax=Frigoriglobus tundricola TaxID=2774151 RepID=A0A6M5YSU6_9BACT|nr:DUF2784 domain-containing protein [Frigoriglobus tundricola]QJW96383.1 putative TRANSMEMBRANE PROTEIN [Frigoriglobus tundricola]
MWYGIAADLMVAIHITYVAYVILGQLAIVIAAPMKWQWARNPWFRVTHLGAIAVVAYEAVRGLRCPLTVWEEQLRALAGQTFGGSDTFMGRILHDLLFVENMPEIAFTIGYCGMALLVVQGLIMYPPRWFRVARTAKTDTARPALA